MFYYSFGQDMIPTADESITVGNTAVGFTAAKTTPTTGVFKNRMAVGAVLTVEVDQIRFWCISTPTDTAGHLLNVGDQVLIQGTSAIEGFKAIRVSSDATIRVTYYHLR